MYLPKIKFNFIFIVLSIFPLLISIGFYGFGFDFLKSYYNSPISWDQPYSIGWNIAGLTIGIFSIGPLIISILLPYSIYFLIKNVIKPKNKSEAIVSNISFLAYLHSWPIILPILNALRQGLATGPFYLIIIYLDKINEEKFNLKISILLILSFFLTFIHKLGFLYFLIILISYLSKNIKREQRRFFILSFSMAIILSIFVFYSRSSGIDARTIGINLALPLLFLAISYCSIFIISKRSEFINKYIFLVPYFMNIFSIAFYFLGYSWQFERLQMTVFIPELLAIISIFKGGIKFYMLILSSLLISFLTFKVGIFERFIRIEDFMT